MKAATRSILRKSARQRSRSRRKQAASSKRPAATSSGKRGSSPKQKQSPARRGPTLRRRRRARRKLPSHIPPILLEGDQPASIALSATETSQVTQALPAAYGTRRLVLTPRDPHWLHAHWDFTREQLREANARSAEGHLTLKLFEQTTDGPPVSETRVHPESVRWFVHVEKPAAHYVASVGYYDARRKWHSLSVSEPVQTPPAAPSPNSRFEMATLAEDGMLTLHRQIPPAEPAWPAERAQAVAEALGKLALPAPQGSSVEWAEGDQPRPTSPPAMPWQPGAAPSGPSSVSSPSGGFVSQSKSFQLRVNAEVIIYGATDPGATVRIGEQEVPLAPDGSFRFRFALPDGAFALPISAMSFTGDDQRSARLELSRSTSTDGAVGVQAQDPALTPPPAKES